jgi:hypothetical protein
MDNRKPSSSTPRTDTVSTGDRGAKGIVFWLIAALILVVAATQLGPLRRYLTVPPLSARKLPPAAAPADTATPSVHLWRRQQPLSSPSRCLRRLHRNPRRELRRRLRHPSRCPH